MRYRLVWLIAAIIALWSCQDSSQPDSSQMDKPQVVRRKITADTTGSLNPKKKEASSETAPLLAKATPKTEPASDDPAATLLGSEDASVAYRYKGEINPFIPLIKEEKSKPTPPSTNPSKKPRTKKRVPQTPLERIDLSQLTLTAVFRNQKGNRAMVEESTGKGYIVRKGTYIGLDGGRITKILRDRILITEVSEDVMGKPVTVERELKLRQFTGE